MGTLIACYLLAIPFGVVGNGDRFSVPEITLAGILLVVLVLSAQSTYSIKNLALGPGGVTAAFEVIDARQSAIEADVHALQVAVAGLVSKFEAVHLEKLAAQGPAVVRFGRIMLDELNRLDAIGYIQPVDVRGLNAIEADHGSGLDDFDLKTYVEITKEGREYLALRAQLAARAARDAAGS